MRRAPELIRKIILAVEAEPSPRAPRNLAIDGHTDEEVGYHCYLIGQQGLAEVTNVKTRGQVGAVILNLTAAGHDFADASRNSSIWNSVLASLKEKAVTVPISILQGMLEQAVKGLFCL